VQDLLATFARSMPQFGLLMMFGIIALRILSGAFTLCESMLEFVHRTMLGVPNRFFVTFLRAVLFRGAGFQAAWRQFAAPALTGSALFVVSLVRVRKALGAMA
jgi:ABC-2 type transport system permease protein